MIVNRVKWTLHWISATTAAASYDDDDDAFVDASWTLSQQKLNENE